MSSDITYLEDLDDSAFSHNRSKRGRENHHAPNTQSRQGVNYIKPPPIHQTPNYNDIFKRELPFYHMNHSHGQGINKHLGADKRSTIPKYKSDHISQITSSSNCIEVAKHVKGCFICDKYYKCDKRPYIFTIITLLLLIVYLMRKISSKDDE